MGIQTSMKECVDDSIDLKERKLSQENNGFANHSIPDNSTNSSRCEKELKKSQISRTHLLMVF